MGVGNGPHESEERETSPISMISRWAIFVNISRVPQWNCAWERKQGVEATNLQGQPVWLNLCSNMSHMGAEVFPIYP